MFNEELGTMKGVNAHIHIPKSKIPSSFKPRPLVFALQWPVVGETEPL